MKTASPLELLGAQRARRAIASRLADAVAHVLGGIGVSLTVTLQDGDGDPKTGSVPFSTHIYSSWGEAFQAQAESDQGKIAVAHLQESIVGLEKQLAAVNKKILEQQQDAPPERKLGDAQIEGEEPS